MFRKEAIVMAFSLLLLLIFGVIAGFVGPWVMQLIG
jgi:hypothetical protein